MAETLFEDAKKMMARGDYAAACPKLSESNRLDPGSGTLTALALCHEHEGKTATAWAEFIQVVSEAQQAGRTDREKFARQHLAALEPVLSRLTITVAPETAQLSDLVVRRDNIAVGAAAWGVASPVDPGDHVVEAVAPGKKSWSAHVSLNASGDAKAIAIPLLDPAPTASAAPVSAAADTKETIDAPPAGHGSSQRIIGLVVGGAGVAALTLGSYFGLQALSKSADAKKLCSPSNCYNSNAVQLNDDAKTNAHLADAVLGGGLVAVGVGAYLFLSAPAQPANSARVRVLPTVSVGSAGASFQATW
jgi:serine/threonine-protein kinase